MVVQPVAWIMTNQLSAYQAIGKDFLEHEWVNHGSRECARGDVHVSKANHSMRFWNGPSSAYSPL
jgi:hypothetical protein